MNKRMINLKVIGQPLIRIQIYKGVTHQEGIYLNTDNIDIEKLNRLKKRLGIDESNNDYVYIEGVGFAFETGKLNLDGLVKRLLKSKYITG